LEQIIDALSELGLNGYEGTIYLSLLSRGGLTPTELATRAKVPRQRVYDILESLLNKGLCTSRDTTPRTFFAVAPPQALEGLSQQRAAALEREREKTARISQELILQLLPIFQTGSTHDDPLAYVDVLSDPSRIAIRALELARSVKVSVNSCIKRPLILSREQNWSFIREPLQRGVHYRALYETSALQDQELIEWMKTFREWGQQIRLVPELPVKMNAFDDTATMLSMQDPVGGPPSFTALSIQHRGTVAFLNLAFERLWEQGEPLE